MTHSISITAALAALTGGDTPAQAQNEGRCLKPPIGCGEPILVDRKTMSYWPNDAYRREWHVTGLCVKCQDEAEASMRDAEDPAGPDNVPEGHHEGDRGITATDAPDA